MARAAEEGEPAKLAVVGEGESVQGIPAGGGRGDSREWFEVAILSQFGARTLPML